VNSNDKRFNSEIGYKVNQLSKTYDLEDRTAKFAKETRSFVKHLPKTIANIEDIKQLVRSSGSVGANYIEANDSLSKKDFFLMIIKICRKEAKESQYRLQLLDTGEKIPKPFSCTRF